MFAKRFIGGGVIVLLLLLVANIAFAQEQKETKFRIGWQGSFPACGISGMVDVADNISVQGMLWMIGDLKTYAGRGIYRFRKEPYWNTYGYGMIGAWSYPGYEIVEYGYVYGTRVPIRMKKITETTIGFGAGVGVEYNWQSWVPNLPPFWWNLEVGIGIVEFKKVPYNFSALMFGCGVHYRF